MTLASPRLHPQVSEIFKLSELFFGVTPDAPAVLISFAKSAENLRILSVNTVCELLTEERWKDEKAANIARMERSHVITGQSAFVKWYADPLCNEYEQLQTHLNTHAFKS